MQYTVDSYNWEGNSNSDSDIDSIGNNDHSIRRTCVSGFATSMSEL
jgi:hypothetical protein